MWIKADSLAFTSNNTFKWFKFAYYNCKLDCSITWYIIKLLQFFKSGDSHGIGFKERYMKLFLFQLWLNQILWLKNVLFDEIFFRPLFLCRKVKSCKKLYIQITILLHYNFKRPLPWYNVLPMTLSLKVHYNIFIAYFLEWNNIFFELTIILEGTTEKGIKIWIASFIT